MFLLVKLMASTNTFTLVFYRSLVQIAIALATLYRQGENPFGPPGTRLLLVMRAVFGAAAVCAWFFGIQVLPLPDAVTLQFTTPPFAAAFAVCIVGEKWMPLDMVGAVVCLTGVALIAHPTWLFGKNENKSDEDDDSAILLKTLAVALTTGGAALAGIAYVCVRKIGNRASAVVMVLYYGVLSVPMVFLGSGLLQGRWNVWGDTNFSVQEFVLLFLMGIAGYGGQWFTNLGLQNETAATVSDSCVVLL
jgi:drug/metabolite transporter (DMT)-like permease